jgi:3-deoxy-D-manno-octulosonic-acid transferase
VANFKLAYAGLTRAGAARIVADADALAATLTELIGSRALGTMRAQATALTRDSEGARQGLLDRLTPLLRV